MVRILAAIFATVIIIFGFYNIYEKKLFDSYSLKCMHLEFDNIEKWFMVKKRFASKQPHAIFEEPWYSNKFNKLTKVNDLSFWGTLVEANTTELLFSRVDTVSDAVIKINRVNLNLVIEANGISLYSCEKQSPEKFYSGIAKTLTKLQSNIKI